MGIRRRRTAAATAGMFPSHYCMYAMVYTCTLNGRGRTFKLFSVYRLIIIIGNKTRASEEAALNKGCTHSLEGQGSQRNRLLKLLTTFTRLLRYIKMGIELLANIWRTSIAVLKR